MGVSPGVGWNVKGRGWGHVLCSDILDTGFLGAFEAMSDVLVFLW